jgi:hypothetical protein
MTARVKQSWCRGAVFAGAVLATAALALGTAAGPAEAQYYGYRYAQPYSGYSPYGYSHYRGDEWRSGNHGWHRGWDRGGRDHARDHRGPGPGAHGRGAAPVGSGNAYMGWLGAHGSYR